MDIIPPSELPGAAFDFRDVRNIFEGAATDLDAEQMLFTEGFSLQDAMSAFEIGEPRLDSGYIPPGDPKPAFNPLAPLLPEELCWIIDRSFSYEMEWHNGNFMSHTVLTFLYIHYLDTIDPDVVPAPFFHSNDQNRPPEYITIVLRAAVAGLLKCCDLTWRELSKGAVQDTEDWQSDKCEIYLLEGTPVRVVTSMLEEASVWISDSPKVPYQWKDPLISRLQLRKTFLQFLDTNVHRSPAQFKSYITICQDFLKKLRSQLFPDIPQNSVARLAFDPYVSKRLSTVVPIRVLPISTRDETWNAFDTFFERLKETSRLAAAHSLSTWKVVGSLRVWTAKLPIQQPYIRSLTQSAFYDGLLVFDGYPFVWMVDKFFYETVGFKWSFLSSQISQRWARGPKPLLEALERDIYKLLIPHIRGNWSNPPRRRRHLMKTLVGWHHLYDMLMEMMSKVDVSDLPQGNIFSVLHRVVLLWRLSSIREIVFSGFQLELYAPEERTVAYWYLTQVFETELQCYEDLLPVVPQDTPAFREMLFNQQIATALQSLCASLFVVRRLTYAVTLPSIIADLEIQMTIPLLSFNWNRTRPNFFRRYKWAFKPDYERFETEPIAHPDLPSFMRACLAVLKDPSASPKEGVELAVALLGDLLGTGQSSDDDDHKGRSVKAEPQFGSWADAWVDERRQFVKRLIDIAEGLTVTLPPNSSHSPPLLGPQLLPLPLSSPSSVPSPIIPSTSTSGSSSISRTTNATTTTTLNGQERTPENELKGVVPDKKVVVSDRGEAGMGHLAGIKLRWDPNVHPWFPIPQASYLMNVE